MDMITLAMAKAYSDSQRLGYTDSKTISWDGDTNGRATIDFGDGVVLYKVTDDVLDLTTVTASSIVGVDNYGNVSSVITSLAEIGAETIDAEVFVVIQEPASGTPLVIAVPTAFEDGGITFEAGTYFAYDTPVSSEVKINVLSITTETIVPIDPKYLPDAVVPKVIDLTKYVAEASGQTATFNDVVLNAFAMGGGSATATDNSAFWNDVSTDRPLRFVFDCEALAPDIKIEADAKSGSLYNGTTHTVETSFLVILDGCARVTVLFGNNFNGTTTITVVAEPLTDPT